MCTEGTRSCTEGTQIKNNGSSFGIVILYMHLCCIIKDMKVKIEHYDTKNILMLTKR